MKPDETTRISISSIAGGTICLAMTDARNVHDSIHDAIMREERVEISFAGVTRMTAAFLNVAVGQLYGEFDENQDQEAHGPAC